MYDLRQFRPTLYLVLILGITGFALSAQTPGLWALMVFGLGLNVWLMRTGRFRPLPRWMANTATILAIIYVVFQIATTSDKPLMFIGEFLVLLQLVKVYEQRANRDYAQMLILSLLLMVAAAINTISLLYAVLLVIYLVLALYCCLLFHLKVETDQARAAQPLPEEEIPPATLRQDQRFLARSMRRLTALVALVSVSVAVAVFIFFPRGAGQGVLGQLQLRTPTALTGFSENMSFGQVARIQQNHEVFAHVKVWCDSRPVQGTQTLYLRGLTSDTYGFADGSWKFNRIGGREEHRECGDDVIYPLYRSPVPGEPIWRQQVSLYPNGDSALFALAGPIKFSSSRQMSLRINAADESLRCGEAIVVPTEYEVWSTDTLGRPAIHDLLVAQELSIPSATDPRVLAEVEKFTRREEIVGAAGMHRSRLFPIDASNSAIAHSIERYLQTNYYYTLDLSDAKELQPARRGDDPPEPITTFLTKTKRGHCEYFARSMAVMCQSLGIPARVVRGFRCGAEDFNALGGYYIVRQSHAHEWVEVLTPEGWERFDPTSGREAPATASSWWRSMRHFFDYLEYKWGESVIAFDRKAQDDTWSNLDNRIMNAAIQSNGFLSRLGDWLDQLTLRPVFWYVASTLLGAMVALMLVFLVVMIVTFVVQRTLLRRRARRIGLGDLPAGRRLRLARQLAFYDNLVQILERRGIVRPRQSTPMEFSDSLGFLPADIYAAVRRLTTIVYRVRYGSAQLGASSQRRLLAVVDRIAGSLAENPEGAGRRR